MPIILIKNNIKLMFRSKWILALMIFGPIVTIGVLSSAFQEMMNTTFKIDKFQVGYRVNSESSYKEMLPQLQTICKDNNVVLKEYPDEKGREIKKLLQNETISVFVDMKKNSYVIYEASDKKTEAAITESIFQGFFHQMNKTMTLYSYGNKIGTQNIPNQNKSKVISEVLDTDPVPSSIDYYGIIYIVYFAWCGMIALLAVVTSERKGAIPRRMRVANLPKWYYYAGKFIPCTLSVFIGVCAAVILSSLMYGVHWGKIGTSVIILLLLSMASAAFGIILFQLFSNVAISIVVGFVITWIAGFFGGSFQAYMYSFLPQKLVDLSPIYYINRTLVEFQTKGYSDYTGRCFAYLIGIIVVFSSLSMLFMNRKVEEV